MRYEDEHFTGTRSIVALSEIARIGAKALGSGDKVGG
jgi:hypothetical protein